MIERPAIVLRIEERDDLVALLPLYDLVFDSDYFACAIGARDTGELVWKTVLPLSITVR